VRDRITERQDDTRAGLARVEAAGTTRRCRPAGSATLPTGAATTAPARTAARVSATARRAGLATAAARATAPAAARRRSTGPRRAARTRRASTGRVARPAAARSARAARIPCSAPGASRALRTRAAAVAGRPLRSAGALRPGRPRRALTSGRARYASRPRCPAAAACTAGAGRRVEALTGGPIAASRQQERRQRQEPYIGNILHIVCMPCEAARDPHLPAGACPRLECKVLLPYECADSHLRGTRIRHLDGSASVVAWSRQSPRRAGARARGRRAPPRPHPLESQDRVQSPRARRS
jgi:hypothetical protein